MGFTTLKIEIARPNLELKLLGVCPTSVRAGSALLSLQVAVKVGGTQNVPTLPLVGGTLIYCTTPN